MLRVMTLHNITIARLDLDVCLRYTGYVPSPAIQQVHGEDIRCSAVIS